MQQSEEMPTIIYCDNMSTIAMTKNPVFHSRTKHIKLRHHFIRKLVQEEEIQLNFVKTNEQLADVFTKVGTSKKLEEFKKNVGIKN